MPHTVGNSKGCARNFPRRHPPYTATAVAHPRGPYAAAARALFGNTETVIAVAEVAAGWIRASPIRRKTNGRIARFPPRRAHNCEVSPRKAPRAPVTSRTATPSADSRPGNAKKTYVSDYMTKRPPPLVPIWEQIGHMSSE